METVSLAQLRRFVVAHQGFATRVRRGRTADVDAAVRRLSAVQLDSISVVERSLPFLYSDRLVGRVALKSDRATGTLIVRAFHVEPKVRVSRALGEALEKALSRLARSVGLEPVRR